MCALPLQIFRLVILSVTGVTMLLGWCQTANSHVDLTCQVSTLRLNICTILLRGISLSIFFFSHAKHILLEVYKLLPISVIPEEQVLVQEILCLTNNTKKKPKNNQQTETTYCFHAEMQVDEKCLQWLKIQRVNDGLFMSLGIWLQQQKDLSLPAQ